MDKPNTFIPSRWKTTPKPWRSQENKEACCQVYGTEWRALQKGLFPTLSKMHRGGRGQIRPGRSTRRDLWRSHGGKVIGQEDHEDGLFLTHDATRRSRIREEVWQLLEIRERSASSRWTNDDYFLTLVVRTMGDRHYGSPAIGKKIDEIPARHNWLLHEMGGSRSSCNNHKNKGTKFCMEKQCLQVRDFKDDHFRQWSSVRQLGIQVILLEPRHQEHVLFARTSPGQRADRSN